MRTKLVFLVAGLLTVYQSLAQTSVELIPTNSTWRYFKGLSEASTPTNAWRAWGFDDAAWLEGDAPFHYGSNAAGGDDDLVDGTILSDMESNYTTLFLRHEFVVETNALSDLTLGMYADDGMIAWINGVLVREAGVRESQVAYTDALTVSREAFYSARAIPFSMLRNGANVLAVQAVNCTYANAQNDDFRIEVRLAATVLDIQPPIVVDVAPPKGSTVTSLNQVTVTFSEPVTGVVASHFLVNGVSSTSVNSSGNIYAFTFAQPAAGNVQVDWAVNHTVYDLNGNRLDLTAVPNRWQYTLVDTVRPDLASISPAAGASVAGLTQIAIEFTEPVMGVDAGDLLVDGQPAASMQTSGAVGYSFQFPSVQDGLVAVTWNPNHNITDTAVIPNPFLPSSWTYLVIPDTGPAQFLVRTNSDWQYFKGLSEASSPTNFWRDVDFDASSWDVSSAPFHYGTNSVGGDDELTGGAILSDMSGNYSCIFMRKEFDMTTNGLSEIKLGVSFDEGYAAFINGQVVRFVRVNINKLAYTDTTTLPFLSFEADYDQTSVPIEYFQNGPNVLAIQAVNRNKSDVDFRIEAELVGLYPDLFGPSILGVAPTPGSTVSNLTEITVAFDEEVTGVAPGELLINGAGALSMTSFGFSYTFSFVQPVAGRVQIRWDQSHSMADTNGNRFDEAAPGASWEYLLVDGTPPSLVSIMPTPETTVANLSQIRLEFSESVAGLDAADLLINGQAATSVVPTGPSTYLFRFDELPDGPANVTWKPSHGIADFAEPPNLFAPSPWSYTVDSTAIGDVVINEFSALWYLDTVLKDEDDDASDWIEIRNRSAASISLLGWSLTTDKDFPGMWEFPDITLAPNEYRVVFASGKDRKPIVLGGELHTNFRLNQFGDYLALYRPGLPPIPASEFTPQYPEQRENISYGFDPSDQLVYFSAAGVTPGAPNPASPTFLGVASEPKASVQSGFFNQPFNLVLSTETPGASIRYTLDGSSPETSGIPYTSPILISGNAGKAVVTVRAAAFKADFLSSRALTRTYIFAEHVLTQPATPAGFPTIWDSPCTGYQNCNDINPADYEMDPQVINDTANNYRNLAWEGLTSIPTVSIVTDVGLLFGAAKGVYVRREPFNHQPINMELILPDGSQGFNIDCGLEMQGQTSPFDGNSGKWKSLKLGLRVMFKGEFGAAKLKYKMFPDSPVEEFDTLMLAGGHNNYWNYNNNDTQRARALYVRDQYVANLQNLVGGLSHHGRFVHLYLNGLYWGLYFVHERPDDNFLASYYGGEQTDYDAFKHSTGEMIAGSAATYNTMWNLVNSGSIDNAKYEQIQQYLDVPGLIDYLIINFWANNTDWDHKNLYASHRKQNGLWRFHAWDSEHVIVDGNFEALGGPQDRQPTGIMNRLMANAEYKLLFADRVHKHFFNDGIFYADPVNPIYNPAFPERNPAAHLFMKMLQGIDTALVCESARWGDVGPGRENTPHTRNVSLYDERDIVMGHRSTFGLHSTFSFANRTPVLLNQFRSLGWYPNVDAPSFNQHGGRVAEGFNLTMTAPAGTIYYTTDDSDPRSYGTGAVSPSATAYAPGSPVVLNASAAVKARVRSGSTWSALNEATFTVGSLGIPLRITEIMYNPAPDGAAGSRYEFIELQNIGATKLELSYYSFEGITFQFPGGFILNPNARIVLGSNASTNDWNSRYAGVTAAGWFESNLRNSGERVALYDGSGYRVTSVEYSDGGGWPAEADGLGYSLEIIDVNGDPNDPANWRASASINGSPGLAPAALPDPVIVINEIMADNVSAVTNGGTLPDWIELHNPGAEPLELAGWSLSDSGDPRKYVFPPGVSLPGGDYLVVWCDSDTNAPGLHTGFALGRNGESVFLYAPAGARVDAITFGPQVADYTVGRVNGSWQLTQPTPNNPNLSATVGSQSRLGLNEWLADAPPGGADWIELHNSSTLPVSLKNIYLGITNALFQLRSLSFIGGGEFVQLLADETAGPDHLDFKLPKSGSFIALFDQTGAEIDRITYGDQAENVTEGRLPDGMDTIVDFPLSPSPAASNYIDTYTGPRLNELMARNQNTLLGPGGRFGDWIELANDSPNPYDLSGMRLSDSPGNTAKWVFPTNSAIAAFGYLIVWCDGSVPATTDAGSVMNTGFSLSGEGGGIYLINPLGQRVDSVQYGFQIPDLSIGRSAGAWKLLASPTPGSGNDIAVQLGSVNNLRINEWMAAPTSGGDWFEIYNIDSRPVSLTGLLLTDDPSLVGIPKFKAGPLSYAAGKGWVLWQADGDSGQGPNHVNFSLDAVAESISLYTATSNLINRVEYHAQTPDVSQGRLPDGGGAIASFTETSTPGAGNYLPLFDVVINEVMAHTDPPVEDAIELYNMSGETVSVGGWYLSNNESDLMRYRIPLGTTIGAGEYLVIYEAQFNSNPGVPPSFGLSSSRGDDVWLSQVNTGGQLTGYRSGGRFGASENRISIGRYQTSAGVDFVALSEHTFGVDNPANVVDFRTGAGATNALPKVGPLVINEIMYHPVSVAANEVIEDPDEEYIELQNISPTTLLLYDADYPTNSWELRNAVDFTFPAGVTLGAGEYLLLVNFDPAIDPAALLNFRTKYGLTPELAIFGPWSGRLSNEGETAEIYQPDSPESDGYVPMVLVERITYTNRSPWPTNGVDGGGASLQRIAASEYGNDPANWKGSAPTAARVNQEGALVAPTIVVPPQPATVLLGESVSFSVTAAGSEPLSYQWLLEGSEIDGANDSSYSIASAQLVDAGDYTVVVTNAAGSVLSSTANLVVLVLPQIVELIPPSAIVPVGSNLTLSVVALGTVPLSYQWYRNDVLLEDQTSAFLPLGLAQLTDSGNYSVVVENTAGSVTSAPVSITVITPPTITRHPQSHTVTQGRDAVFEVEVIGEPPFSYQWYVNGEAISGATDSSLTVTSAQLSDEGNQYTVVVGNAVGMASSMAATLSVVARPVLENVQLLSNGLMSFTINGHLGETYSLESSTNLSNWDSVPSEPLSSGHTNLVDTITNGLQLFFRARQSP